MNPKLRTLIDELSRPELEEARAYLSLRLGLNMSAKAGKESNLPHLVLDVICDVARSKGIDMTQPPTLQKSSQFPSFRSKIEERQTGEYLRTAASRSRIKLRAFVMIAVQLLIENMQEMNVPISSRTVMSHIHRIPAVIDQAFPGYAQAGLLHLLTREKEEPNVRDERSDEAIPRRNGKAVGKRRVLHHSGGGPRSRKTGRVR